MVSVKSVLVLLTGVAFAAGLTSASPVSITFSGSTTQLANSKTGLLPPQDFDLVFFYDAASTVHTGLYAQEAPIEQVTLYLSEAGQTPHPVSLSTSQALGALYVQLYDDPIFSVANLSVRIPSGLFNLLATAPTGTVDLSNPPETTLSGGFYMSGGFIKLTTVDGSETYTLPAGLTPFPYNVTFGKYDSDAHSPGSVDPGSPVPEPEACSVAGAGLVALFLYTRSRHSKAL